MSEELRIAIIGLDTSHTPAFVRILQAPDCPEDQRVRGAKAVTCLRFSTPFQSEEGLDKRQKELEGWGVRVTTDFDEAVAGCDAIALEINDPGYHLEYFAKCTDLGKPIFIDKPLADNIENGRTICKLAKEKGLRVCSSSCLRSVPQVVEACCSMPEPLYASTYGPLGIAPSGSSIVWYGVHAFEMLERAMGRGARAVYARADEAGVVCAVDYDNARRGVVELTKGTHLYGGCLRDQERAIPFVVDMSVAYREQVAEVVRFFRGGSPPAELEDALEIMGMLDAAERSCQSGKAETL